MAHRFSPRFIEGTGSGFPNETVDALWSLVWEGLVTNDTHAAAARVCSAPEPARAQSGIAARHSGRGRLVPPRAEGRWSLVEPVRRRQERTRGTTNGPPPWRNSCSLATASSLARRSRPESVAGGFSAVYQVLKAMEEAGRIRRGYFVAGLGAAQFAMPAALDLLRSMRDAPEEPRTVVMAATDPANPYGALVKWPDVATGGSRRSRQPPVAGPPGSQGHSSCSLTAVPPPTCAVENGSCCCFSPRRNRCARA